MSAYSYYACSFPRGSWLLLLNDSCLEVVLDSADDVVAEELTEVE